MKLSTASQRPDHRKTQATYDRLSRWYDFLEGNWEKPARDAGLEILTPEQGETILEIGTGTGSACLAMAEAMGSEGCIVGIDLSMGMLQASRTRLKKKGQAGRVYLSAGDACLLPLRDAAVDAIYCSFSLELFPDEEIDCVLNECRRALKPGGRICIVALSAAGSPSRARRIYEWFHHSLPGIVDCRPIFVQEHLANMGFAIQKCIYTQLWLIPVEIVIAHALI